MRVKTEAKRIELLRAATEVFLEQGYERTLMAHVSDRAKCSKGTLYSYFASKEDMFSEVVISGTAKESDDLFVELEASNEKLETVLLKFGEGFLKTLYAPRFQALRRLVFSAAFDQNVGQTVYEKGIKPYEARAAGLLAVAMEKGEMQTLDPEIAAHHLCGLLESELLLKFLLGTLKPQTPAMLNAVAKRAVAAFCAAYENKVFARHACS